MKTCFCSALAIAFAVLFDGCTTKPPDGVATPVGEEAPIVELPTHIDFWVTGGEVPRGTSTFLVHFERDMYPGLGLEVTQEVTPSSDGKRPKAERQQEAYWLGVNGDRVLHWTIPEEFTAEEVREATRGIEENLNQSPALAEGAILEFANIKHRDGWTLRLLARVLRESAPHAPCEPSDETRASQ